MSNFLTNLARRGAGLAPAIAPHPAAWSSPFSAKMPAALPMPAAEAHVGFSQDAPARDATFDRPTLYRNERDGDTGVAERQAPSAAAPASVSPSRLDDHDPPAIHKLLLQVSPLSISDHRPVPASPTRRLEPLPDSDAAVAKQMTPRPIMPDVSATGRASRDADGPDASLPVAPRNHAEAWPLAHRSAAPVAIEPHAARPALVPQPAIAVTVLAQAKPEGRSSAPTPAEPRRIQVRIGKVEVRASQPAAPLVRISPPKRNSGFAELGLARAHLNRNYC